MFSMFGLSDTASRQLAERPYRVHRRGRFTEFTDRLPKPETSCDKHRTIGRLFPTEVAMTFRPFESTRRCFAAEILDLERAVDIISRSLVRLRTGFEELSDMASLPPSLDLDDQIT